MWVNMDLYVYTRIHIVYVHIGRGLRLYAQERGGCDRRHLHLRRMYHASFWSVPLHTRIFDFSAMIPGRAQLPPSAGCLRACAWFRQSMAAFSHSATPYSSSARPSCRLLSETLCLHLQFLSRLLSALAHMCSAG